VREIDLELKGISEPKGKEDRDSIRIHTKSILNLSLKDLAKLMMGQRCSLSMCFKIETRRDDSGDPWSGARLTKYSVKLNVHKRGEAIPTKEAIFDDKDLHKKG